MRRTHLNRLQATRQTRGSATQAVGRSLKKALSKSYCRHPSKGVNGARASAMAILTRTDATRAIDRFYIVDVTPTLFGEWACANGAAAARQERCGSITTSTAPMPRPPSAAASSDGCGTATPVRKGSRLAGGIAVRQWNAREAGGWRSTLHPVRCCLPQAAVTAAPWRGARPFDGKPGASRLFGGRCRAAFPRC